MAIEKEIQLTIKVKGKDPFTVSAKVKGLEALSRLDSDDFDKLVLLSQSPQAKEYLKNNWGMLKGMLGIKE